MFILNDMQKADIVEVKQVVVDKVVRFDPLISVRHVPAEGKMLKVNRSSRATWRAGSASTATRSGGSGSGSS